MPAARICILALFEWILLYSQFMFFNDNCVGTKDKVYVQLFQLK